MVLRLVRSFPSWIFVTLVDPDSRSDNHHTKAYVVVPALRFEPRSKG